MAADNATPQEKESEPTDVLAFRSGVSDKAGAKMLATIEETSESEILRRFFNFDAFRAEVERVRTLREQLKSSSAA